MLQHHKRLRLAGAVGAILCALGMLDSARGGEASPSPLALISDVSGSPDLEATLFVSRTRGNSNAQAGMTIFPGDRLTLRRCKAELIVPREGVVCLNAEKVEANWPPDQSPGLQPKPPGAVNKVWDSLMETAMWILQQRREIVKGAVGKGGPNDQTKLRLICLGCLPPKPAVEVPREGVVFWTAPSRAQRSFELAIESGNGTGTPRFLALTSNPEIDYGEVTLYSSTFVFTNGWPPDIARAMVAHRVRRGLSRSDPVPWPTGLAPALRELIGGAGRAAEQLDGSSSLSEALLLEAANADALALRVHLAYLRAHPDSIEGHLALVRFFEAHQASSPAKWHLERAKPKP